MENPRSLEMKVGIFVAVSVAVVLTFIIALGGDKGLFHGSNIYRMELEETGGLSVGSIVQVSGIQAGNVAGLEFNRENNKVIVNLKVDKTFADRLTKGSTAGLRTQGALGDKYVLIKPGPIGGEILKPGAYFEVEPPTDLLSTLGRSGPRFEKVFTVLDNLEKLTAGLNDRNFAANLSETAKNMKASSQSLEEILGSVRGQDPKNNKVKRSIDHIASILEKIDNGQGSLGGFINDPTVHEDLKTILGGAKRSKLLKFLIKQAIKKGDEEEAPAK